MKCTILVSTFLALATLSGNAQSNPPLSLQQTIDLPGVTGKFDHFAVDLVGDRLFAAATGIHAVEVIDLKTGKVQQTIPDLGKPHGLAWIASSQTLFVADGAKAELQKYHGTPLSLVGTLHLSDDTDDLVYDEPNKLLFVGHGGSDATNPARVAVVDTDSLALKRNIAIASHPESLEIDTAAQRIFVNVAEANEVAVLDGNAGNGQGILAKWKLTKAADNVPLAFDSKHHALYVACRAPAALVVIDADSGKELSSILTVGGADDLFYDPALQRVYSIGGAGEVEVYDVNQDRSLRSLGKIHTAAGAKTALFVPSTSRLYVGIPGADGKDAAIRVYSTSAMRAKQ